MSPFPSDVSAGEHSGHFRKGKESMTKAFLTGIDPRSERLVEATRRHDRGLTTDEELKEALGDNILQLVHLQEEANFNYITDGLLNWQDLLRPIASRIEGISEGPLTRWFDNNSFYRRPVIVGEMAWRPRQDQTLIYSSLFPNTRLWKAILPGPYTFTALPDSRYYSDKGEVLDHYTDVLREEIRGLKGEETAQVIADGFRTYCNFRVAGPVGLEPTTFGFAGIRGEPERLPSTS